MGELDEPILTTEQRKEIDASLRFYDGTGGDLWPNDAKLFQAMAARLRYLESERTRMYARADRATAELLALGRELRQARAEAAVLRLAVSASERILGDLSARAGDRADKEGVISDPPQLQLDYWRAVLRPALEASPLAAHAAAVLACAVTLRERDRGIPPTGWAPHDDLDAAVDAYRSALASKVPTA